MMTWASKPLARCVRSHLLMSAPGLLALSRPVWKPIPAFMRTGPQPRSTSICATDGPQPLVSYDEPSITESPTIATGPRGPCAGLSRSTKIGMSAAVATLGADAAAGTAATVSATAIARAAIVRRSDRPHRRSTLPPRPTPATSCTDRRAGGVAGYCGGDVDGERVRLPAGARRGPRRRRRDGARVPPRPRLLRGRVPRRVGVLHPVGLPDHVAADPREASGPARSRRRRSTCGVSAGSCRRASCASPPSPSWAPPGCTTAAATFARTCSVRCSRCRTGWRSPANQSYADLFAAPSPLDHFWSLAIEEQFYWVWPLTVAAIGTFAARRAGAPR